MSARMTKDATGIAFISWIGSSKRSPMSRNRQESAPVASPAKKARKNPRQIRPKEKPAACQKDGVKSWAANTFTVSAGPTSRMGLSSFRQTSCQIASQKKMTAVFLSQPGYFFCWQGCFFGMGQGSFS